MLYPMRVLSLSHSVYCHQYHIVWGTKYRRKFLKDYVKTELLRVANLFVKKYPTLQIEALNTGEDHVHLQMEIPPNVLVSSAIGRLKWLSSLKLKRKFHLIEKMYLKRQSIWSVGYFSSTIGLNEGQIREYIKNQDQAENCHVTQLKLS